jgi:hypothetical protein
MKLSKSGRERGDEEALSGTQQNYYVAIDFKVKSSTDDPCRSFP